ncbi:hypothetical protein [Methylorubrum populi]|uniref:hypothetical protein n=1 Tax=Methylorubrum populi TaxID=223967 RepID=UPI002357FE57|nr:hypothetical protein [Methylorubrum populi]
MPFTKGQRVRMLVESIGDDANDVERTYPAGTLAVVDDIDDRGIHHVVVGPPTDDSIVQCFDTGPEAEAAMKALPYLRAEPIPYSSVVGAGVLLHDETGKVIGKIALLGVEGGREAQEALRDRLVKAISAGQPERQVTHTKRGSTYDVVASAALFQVSDRQDLHGIPKGRIVEDGDPVTVYCNEHGTFVRFPDEMVSPRFEEVTS